MTPTHLRKWRGNRSQKKAATDIGMSSNHYQKLEGGQSPIRLLHELACEGWAARQLARKSNKITQ